MQAFPKNVVFLAHRVPHPPDRGDRISTVHILRQFREAGCRVRIGCLSEDDRDEEALGILRGLVDEVVAPRIDRRVRKLISLKAFLTGEPMTLPFFRVGELQRAVDRWLDQDPPDLVFAYSSSMALYLLGKHDRSGIPRIMHFAELDSDKWRQYAGAAGPLGSFVYGREARTLLGFERRIARAFDASLVISEVERRLFEQYVPGVTPTVVPNGVDTEHFRSAGEETRESHTLIFTGVMDYEPNVDGVLWFVEHCWPELRREFPSAQFLIVGNRPVPKIQALNGRDGLVVTGWVDETPPYFDRASVAIAPLRIARGLQNKVLEAMSMGLPTVASTVAAQGLGEVPGDTLLVHDEPEAVVESIRRLWNDPAEARATGQRAADFVRREFTWERSFERLAEVYDRVLSSDRA